MYLKLTAEAKEFLARIKDKVDIVTSKHIEQVTDFTDPYLTGCGVQYLEKVSGIAFLPFGGAADAERKRIIICPEYIIPEPVMAKVGIVEYGGKAEYKNFSHRDFLGALMGQGIKREKIGDIYPLKSGFVVITTEEIKEYLLLTELNIKGITFLPQGHDLKNWTPPEQESQMKAITVPSLRLDTITANGFGLSRTAVVDFIKSGKIKVNWQVTENTAYLCQKGDTISFRGKGRIKIIQVGGQSKKGRLKLTIERFL